MTWVEEADFGAVDLKLIRAATLKAVAETLKEFPELNARLEGDEIVYLDRYDLGFAVQTDHGLVVPVVARSTRARSRRSTPRSHRLADAARGTTQTGGARGSTFSVTNAGKLAGLFQTPIVNHPEVAILSLGRIADRPVVRGGEVVVRPLGYVALTFDHRVVDGARAAAFGLAVIERLHKARARPRAGPPSATGRAGLVVALVPVVQLTADLPTGELGRVDVRVRADRHGSRRRAPRTGPERCPAHRAGGNGSRPVQSPSGVITPLTVPPCPDRWECWRTAKRRCPRRATPRSARSRSAGRSECAPAQLGASRPLVREGVVDLVFGVVDRRPELPFGDARDRGYLEYPVMSFGPDVLASRPRARMSPRRRRPAAHRSWLHGA